MEFTTERTNFRFNWRLSWYSVLVWLLLALVSSLAVFPWFYLTVPSVVVLSTALFLRGDQSGDLFARSLKLGVFWFFSVFTLDLIMFVGLDPDNFYLYLVDGRSFLKLPVVILVPVLFGLLKEQRLYKHRQADFSPTTSF